MTINKVGSVGGSGYEPQKKQIQNIKETSGKSDNITISDAAKIKAGEIKLQTEVQNITKKILQSGQDAERTEKLKEIKAKLKNGDYDNLTPEMTEAISDKLTDVFLG